MDLASKLKDPKLFRQQCYINGAWVDADSGATVDVDDPATGIKIGTIPDIGAAETRRAIEAANASWGAWRAKTGKERAVILKRWAELQLQHVDDLATILTAEMGKPLAESKGEITIGAAYVEWFAEEAKRVYGDIIPNHLPGKRALVIKQPVGVVGAITPWNFPSSMITRKVAPALAVGCPVVIKPAKMTPYSALVLAELAERAGIPAGVFNVVVGNSASAIGNEICDNPIVRKIGFTGSTPIGKMLMERAAKTVKKVSLELGGNAPMIVFDDADMDEAIVGTIASKFRNTGQTCVCANRIFVQDVIYDTFAEKLAEAVKAMKQGHGLEEGTVLGPLIEGASVDKVEEHVMDAVSKGGKVMAGGERGTDLGANFYRGTVVANATPDMKIFREETFGPVAPLFRFKSEEEVIQMANDTEYGLASYFYARDLGRVWRVAEGLEYGMVGVNEGVITTEVAPFGGMKESGLGREGSKYGTDEFVEVKYILMGGIGAP